MPLIQTLCSGGRVRTSTCPSGLGTCPRWRALLYSTSDVAPPTPLTTSPRTTPCTLPRRGSSTPPRARAGADLIQEMRRPAAPPDDQPMGDRLQGVAERVVDPHPRPGTFGLAVDVVGGLVEALAPANQHRLRGDRPAAQQRVVIGQV